MTDGYVHLLYSITATGNSISQLDTSSQGNQYGTEKAGGTSQREGMGLIEYQAMPSLRDVAHDGWLCKQQQEKPSVCSWTAFLGQPVRYRKRRRYGPVRRVGSTKVPSDYFLA
jgi:hypothetical protein